MTVKRVRLSEGRNRRRGKCAKRDSGVFRYYILPVGKERKKLGKAKMKGRGGEKTRCKNRIRRREISDRHRKKGSLILSMISTSQKKGTEKTRSRRSAPFDRACFAARRKEMKNKAEQERKGEVKHRFDGI